MPTIAPTTVGFSSYTVSSSANGWFYLDLDLEFGQQADRSCSARARPS